MLQPFRNYTFSINAIKLVERSQSISIGYFDFFLLQKKKLILQKNGIFSENSKFVREKEISYTYGNNTLKHVFFVDCFMEWKSKSSSRTVTITI